jgi:Uma2 family endonuclease
MGVAVNENFVLDKFTAINFLINDSGRRILLNDVSWKEYEMFLADFEEKSGWRLAYDEGKLEIMPPTYEHEYDSFSFGYFISAYCEEFEIEFVGAGSTTLRRAMLNKGVEPDECFYIQNADKVIGKIKSLDSQNYPMPDVVVEIDVTTDSLDKFPIYSALKVPEVWIYNGKKVTFNKLKGKKYHQISHSVALPLLSAEKLTEFLKLSQEKGQTFALKSFRQYLNGLT